MCGGAFARGQLRVVRFVRDGGLGRLCKRACVVTCCCWCLPFWDDNNTASTYDKRLKVCPRRREPPCRRFTRAHPRGRRTTLPPAAVGAAVSTSTSASAASSTAAIVAVSAEARLGLLTSQNAVADYIAKIQAEAVRQAEVDLDAEETAEAAKVERARRERRKRGWRWRRRRRHRRGRRRRQRQR